MTQGAAGPAERRLHAVPAPATADTSSPNPERASTAPEVRALLAQLDDLRLLLSTDLEVAASAVDAGALDVARDLLAGAQDDLAVFRVRAGHALRDPADSATGPSPCAVVPARRRRRLSVLAPALTAAAALVGVLLGVVPTPTTPAAPDRTIATDAASSFAELQRLHEQGAPATLLARVARQLHAEVSRLVRAGAAPVAVAEALRLLELQRRVLADPQHGGALAAELAMSERLVAVLRATGQGTPAAALLAEAPLPGIVLGSEAGPAAAGPSAPPAGDLVVPSAPRSAGPSSPARGDRDRPAAVPVPAPQQAPTADGGPQDAPAREPAPEPQDPASPPDGAPAPAPAGPGTGSGTTGSTSAGPGSTGSAPAGPGTTGSTTEGPTTSGPAATGSGTSSPDDGSPQAGPPATGPALTGPTVSDSPSTSARADQPDVAAPAGPVPPPQVQL